MSTNNLARRSSALLIVAATVFAASACTVRVTGGDATTAHPTASSPAAAPGAERTIADYIRDTGITETPVRAGDATAPTIELPALAGWVDATAQAGENVYVAVKYEGEELTAADYTPNVVVLLSRLTGRTIDGDALLAVAPGEVRNLTGYAPYGSPRSEKLAGHRAYKIAATYDLDGMPALVGQSTVLVPGRDATYIVQISVTGARSQEKIVQAAVQKIDRELRIRV